MEHMLANATKGQGARAGETQGSGLSPALQVAKWTSENKEQRGHTLMLELSQDSYRFQSAMGCGS